MINKGKYSPLEDQIIGKMVKKHSNNLDFAFSEASKLISRTKTAISQRYYNVIRKNTPLFAIVSAGGITINIKNQKRNTDGKVQKMDKINTDNILSVFNTLTPSQKTKFRNAIN